MHQLFLLSLLLYAVNVSAQLDRIRFHMSEQDFVKAFPEAKRDLNAESGWVGDTSNVYGVSGNAGWRIYNDTIETYRFSSERRAGPGNKFPKVDSADVHELKVAADKLRMKFELQLGKPATLINRPLVGDNPMNITVVYLAEWTYPDKTYLRIIVTQDLSSGNRINAPVVGKVPSEEYYEMNVLVNNRSVFTSVNYKVGKSSAEFFAKYPQCRKGAHFLGFHNYFISDTATTDKAKWSFVFSDGRLVQFHYFVAIAAPDSTLTTQEANERLVKKAEQLLAEGDRSFGKPDTLRNRMSRDFVYQQREAAFIESLLFCKWSEYNEHVQLSYSAMTYGKRPGALFTLSLSYTEVP